MIIYKTGTTLYLVHKSYVDEKLNGGKVRVCKVKSYENIGGGIFPILSITGSPIAPDIRSHYVYEALEDAVSAVDTDNTLKTKSKKKNAKKHK